MRKIDIHFIIYPLKLQHSRLGRIQQNWKRASNKIDNFFQKRNISRLGLSK